MEKNLESSQMNIRGSCEIFIVGCASCVGKTELARQLASHEEMAVNIT